MVPRYPTGQNSNREDQCQPVPDRPADSIYLEFGWTNCWIAVFEHICSTVEQVSLIMRDSSLRVGAVVLACFLSSVPVPALGATTASVHVVGVDAYGNTLGVVSVDSFTDSAGKDWSSRFKEGVAQGLPPGRYRLDAFHSGRHCEMDVDVYSDDSWVTAAFEAAVIEEGTRLLTPVNGRVKNMAGGDGTLCRLDGFFLQLRYEAPLKAGGLFDFGLVPPGTFTFSCFKGAKVLLLRSVRIEGGQQPLVVETYLSERR